MTSKSGASRHVERVGSRDSPSTRWSTKITIYSPIPDSKPFPLHSSLINLPLASANHKKKEGRKGRSDKVRSTKDEQRFRRSRISQSHRSKTLLRSSDLRRETLHISFGMSPAPKSKTKDKLAAKAAKEQTKASIKPSAVPANGGNGAPASAYNPISGTFHALDNIASGSLTTAQQNGRFRTIDETEDNSGSSFGTATEFESSSNNGSCSGESEEKTTDAPRVEPVPGSDTDKREKIRQKNEKKHQRQKERRTQELHERCTGYLMSRKLEVLAQQLVAMGFSSEQATMALILNEGRPEESVTWLFEGGLESKQQVTANIESGANLKIDITDELAKIADMEGRFKCTRQEVERAVVACEGDLEKAEETLKTQKLEPEVSPRKVEEPHDSLVAGHSNNIALDTQNSSLKIQQNGLVAASTQQQRRDDRDFNYTRSTATGAVPNESLNRNLQSSRKLQTKPDWGRSQIPATADKRWSSASPTPPVSYSLPSSLQVPVPPNKSEARYMMASNEAKANLHSSTLREHVIVMQRPQTVNAKQNIPSTSLGINMSPPVSTGWHSNGMSNMEMLKVANGGVGHGLSNYSTNGPNIHQFSPHNHFQDFVSTPFEDGVKRWIGAGNHTVGSASPSLSVPSSLGLFKGWGSSGSASSADWSNGEPKPRDYTSIDWSVDSSLLRPLGKSGPSSDTWSTMFMGGGNTVVPIANGGRYLSGIQDTDTSSTVGSHEWTSPFAGKDLFRVPRQFVTSPSL